MPDAVPLPAKAGLKPVRSRSAQDPAEAGHDGMTRSAVATGLADATVPAASIPAALASHAQAGGRGNGSPPPDAAVPLAEDLPTRAASFFRDPSAFGVLAEQVIPGLLRDRAPGDPVRIWVPGCSTGEEAYSLAILFHEALASAQHGTGEPEAKLPHLKLQVFASDTDADAVAAAREGLYPPAIASDVSAARLQRFFTDENGHGYRVHPDVRASVVFTVQGLQTPPALPAPGSRILPQPSDLPRPGRAGPGCRAVQRPARVPVLAGAG